MYEDFKTIEEMIAMIVDIANFLEDNLLGGKYEGVMTVGDVEYDVEVYDNECYINGKNFEISYMYAEDDAHIEEVKKVLGIKEEAV